MTVRELIDSGKFELVNGEGDAERTIGKPFCCDLLSIAMGRAPAGSAWVTVMANINTLAVAELTDAACVILAEGVTPDELVVSKAKTQEIIILKTELPVFDTALWIYGQAAEQAVGQAAGQAARQAEP